MDINFETMNDFHQTISTKFFGALAAAPPSEWQRIATEIPSTSARNTYPFLGELESMRKWIGPRIIKQLASHRYSIENDKYELTMSAKVDEISDDAGGAVSLYGARAEIMARAVSLQPDELMMGDILVNAGSLPCYDGQNFFDTDHPVGASTVSNDMGGSGDAWYLLDLSKPLKPFIYQNRQDPLFATMTDFSNPHVFMLDEFVWGCKRRNAGGFGLWQTAVRSKQTLDATNLRAAWERLVSFKNDEGRKFGMRPTLLLVGASNEFVASDLLDLQIVQGASGNSSITNKFYKKIPYMVSAYLP